MDKVLTLTEAQNRVFIFITRYIADNKRPPSVREIAKKMNYSSTNAVAEMLDALEKKEYISRRGGSRGIEIIRDHSRSSFGFGSPAQDNVVRVPIKNIDPYTKKVDEKLITTGEALYFDKKITGDKPCFLITTDDDGMAREGILRGDMVLVEEREITEADKGQPVAAIAEDIAIVRTVRFVNDRIHLLAANTSYSEKSIKLTEKHPGLILCGPVKLVIRNLKITK
ncbi:MAG: MarR family transcriptional regulator [Chlorobiales bacterium]|jgi:repressor LexA|nr:MarR family transcriptional regulator [Chlorobiales bacterium]